MPVNFPNFMVNFANFPIVSSCSSTLEEPLKVRKEPKEYNAKLKEEIVLNINNSLRGRSYIA